MTHPVYSYFPGCSLVTSAKENNESMVAFLDAFGIRLEELVDWNCCGSSSAHSLDNELALDLACRNLSLAPETRPLLVACPSCYLRLKGAHNSLNQDIAAQKHYENKWKRPHHSDLQIVHFFELLHDISQTAAFQNKLKKLAGLRIAPYYGCMLAYPPALRRQQDFSGIMENVIDALGGISIRWSFSARCCGTFLTAARPDIVSPIINQITRGAIQAGADCIVTACAMCHMNLEIRSAKPNQLPIFHFSEILALALGLEISDAWFSRHLIDPIPLLAKKRLL
jgi:heterodisulfide reductase subunit B